MLGVYGQTFEINGSSNEHLDLPFNTIKTINVRVVLIISFLALAIINGLSGYGYIFGGVIFGSLSEAVQESQNADSKSQNKRKIIKPESALETIEVIVSTKYGAFGLFLLILAFLQGLVGSLSTSGQPKILRMPIPTYLKSYFLIAIGGLTLISEILGGMLTSFGYSNYFGLICASFLLIYTSKAKVVS